MELQKFTGETMREAMDAVRRALGENAMILDSRAQEKHTQSHDVFAAGAEVWAYLPSGVSADTPSPIATAHTPTPLQDDVVRETTDCRFYELQRQVHAVHQQLEVLSAEMHWLGTGGLSLSTGLSYRIGDYLAQHLSYSGGLHPIGEQYTVAVIGMTGVGKTTAIARLARQWQHEQQISVGMITMDTGKIGGLEQAQAFCRYVDMPLEVVHTADEISSARQRLSECQLILMDTPGVGPRDAVALELVQATLAAADPHEVHLVLSAAQNPMVNREVIQVVGSVQPDQVIVTKIDETAHLYELVALLVESGLAVSYFSDGASIDDALPIATNEKLCRFLLQG